VRSLLEHINDDPSGGGWISLGDVLPLLAEAAPEEFLAAVEVGLDGERSPVVALLDTGAVVGLFSRSYQAPVLWGLESLAWSPSYLPRGTRSLVRWASKDPGGKWSNRPGTSFRLIFLPWFPQTAASVDARIAILESMAAEDGAWPLLKSLLRQPLDHSGMSHRPAWRTWAPPDRREVSAAERDAVESAVVGLLVAQVGSNARRWLDLLESFQNLGLADRAAVAAAIQRLDSARLSDDDRQLIWRKLEEEIAQHRAFRGKAAWAMSEVELTPFLAVVDRFAPTDVVSEVVWLFEVHPEIELVTGGTDYERYQELLATTRAEAINRALEAGWDAVDRLVVRSESPIAVGFTIGESGGDERHALAWGTGTPAQVEAMCGFMAGRTNQAGWAWAEATAAAWLPAWGPGGTAQAIQSANRRRDGWELAARLGRDVEAAYWASFQGFWRGGDAWVAIAKLLEFGHAFAAIDLISAQLHDGEEFDTALTHRALLEAAGAEPRTSHDASTLQYYIPRILDRLEAAGIPESDIARLEWIYLVVLEHSERPATRLGRLLASDPAFFVEVLSLVYRAEGESPRDLEADELRMADQARSLLTMWKTPPGSTDDGIDGEALRLWVTEVRRLAAEAGRGTIADFKTGQVLWWSPMAPDGHRPAEPVRELIEAGASDTLDRGFANEAFNSRGVIMRGRGGDQERELVSKYQETADALRGTWPRTAAIFDGLATVYLEEAERWDIKEAIDADDAAERA